MESDPMQYMLAFNEHPDQFTTRNDADAGAYWEAWRSYMAEMGPLIRSGAALQGPETGSTLRHRDGRAAIQDGPNPDAKELLGGFVIIEADDLDAALAWAGKAPCAATGSVEVRPVMPMDT
jgi:hypothetical protein